MLSEITNENLTIAVVLKKLEAAVDDTARSKEIFNLEEGREYKHSSGAKRDWIIIANLYNEGKLTQKFHLKNYLNFRIENGVDPKNTLFKKNCYRYLRNLALILYIREVIFQDNEQDLNEAKNIAIEHLNRKNAILNQPTIATKVKNAKNETNKN